MDEKALELRVGLVVLAALGSLVAFVLLIGDFHFAKQYKLFVDFKFSGAIAEGAPVKISGVPIGRVERIEYIGLTPPKDGGERLQTRLTVAIDESKRNALPEGTEFFISTQGLLGEQYLEAVPGDRAGAPIAAGSIMRGIDPPRTDILIARMNIVLESFSRLITDNKGLLESLARAAAGLTKNIDELLEKKRGAISETLDNLSAMSKEAKDITVKINSGMGSAEELRVMVKNLQKIADSVQTELPAVAGEAKKTLAAANAILADQKDSIKRSIANVESLSEDGKVIAKKIRRGEGSVGAVLADEDIYDDLKELLRDLKQHPWKIIWRD